MKPTIIYLFISLLIISCSNKKTEKNTEEAATDIVILTEDQFKNANIKTDSIKLQNINTTLKVTGIIDVPPQNLVSISLPLGGYVKHTKLLPGMHFNKGEVIAEVEDIAYIKLQQDYLIAKAEYEFLTKETERQFTLNREQASSNKVYEQTLADLKKQEALLNSLKQQLSLLGIDVEKLSASNIKKTIQVKAPIEGFVTKVNVNVGKYVNPTDVLFELVNPDDIHLNLNVFEKDLKYLYINQPLVAYTNFNKEKKYPCTVLLIGKDITPERYASVHCHFEKYDNLLHPGTYMNAEINISSKKYYSLPNQAVVFFNNKHFVFVEHKEPNTFKMTEIEIEAMDDNFTGLSEETNKLLKDKKIVTRGAYSLLMKLKNEEEDE
ncbi:MAG: efflux RND transporter periplasmic adaptor subunit [Bacteroidia bacterium]